MATTPSRRARLSSDPLVASPLVASPCQSSTDCLESETKEKSRLRSLSREFKRCQRHVPFSQKLVDYFYRVPPRLRMFVLLGWLLWKVIVTLLFLRLLWAGAKTSGPWRGGGTTASTATAGGLRLNTNTDSGSAGQPTRILYIITALAEYNTGRRQTVAGQDRLGEVLVPVLVDCVESLVSFHYEVDVYLILGYTLRPERRRMIVDRLPDGVGLQVWDEATPIGYPDSQRNTMELNTRALSRQHRYVIKDKLDSYDLFMAFEDDMRITGPHVQHFLQMSAELDRLRNAAPDQGVPEEMDPKKMKFFGTMTSNQMKRLIPGFVRVEVLVNETEYGAQTKLDPIPLDHDFPNVGETHFDPSICCHVPNMQPNNETPKHPPMRDVVVWETDISALCMRQLSGSSMLDWVVLLPGPGKMLAPEDLIGGYWSGRDGAFGKMEKPSPGMPKLIAQQGGWMATRQQVIHLNSGQCHGTFLPPFDMPMYKDDGHVMKNVEFWSGGYQFFTGVRGGCNMQRLVSFHPDHFSKHFIYHVANNKQKQLGRQRLVRADDLLAQLNSVRKAAERTMASMIK